MAKKIVLELTEAEARAVYRILGNTMEFPDQVFSMFENKHERLAAYRAYVKFGGPDRSGDTNG